MCSGWFSRSSLRDVVVISPVVRDATLGAIMNTTPSHNLMMRCKIHPNGAYLLLCLSKRIPRDFPTQDGRKFSARDLYHRPLHRVEWFSYQPGYFLAQMGSKQVALSEAHYRSHSRSVCKPVNGRATHKHERMWIQTRGGSGARNKSQNK